MVLFLSIVKLSDQHESETFGFGLQTNNQPTPSDLPAVLKAIST